MRVGDKKQGDNWISSLVPLSTPVTVHSSSSMEFLYLVAQGRRRRGVKLKKESSIDVRVRVLGVSVNIYLDPKALINYPIDTFSREGHSVLDLFLGSCKIYDITYASIFQVLLFFFFFIIFLKYASLCYLT